MMKDAGPRDVACMLENTDVCPPNCRQISVINIEVSSGGHLGFRTRLSDLPWLLKATKVVSEWQMWIID